MKNTSNNPGWWKSEFDTDDLERINIEYPDHDRTSCNDENLYNAGDIFLRYRCERCESLNQLRMQEIITNLMR